MALTIDLTAPDFYEVSIRYRDVRGEKTTVTFMLDGALDSTAIQNRLRWFELLTNAAIDKCTVTARYEATAGRSVAVASPEQLVAAFAAITFQRTDPVNSAKTISKSIAIPAYISALWTTGGTPDETQTQLALLIAALEDDLVIQANDGNYYVGGFTYNDAGSGFGTKPSKTDGL